VKRRISGPHARRPENALRPEDAFIAPVQGLGVLALVPHLRMVLHSVLAGWNAHLAFTNWVFGEYRMIFSNRYWGLSIFSIVMIPNRALWYVTTAALGFLAVALFVPFVNGLFHFAPLHPWQYLFCLAMGVVTVIINEIAKLPFLIGFFPLRFRR
jgi:Ca2+-transporting ATPase